MKNSISRENAIASITRSQRAAAIGRLMLGELSSWEDFLSPENTDFSVVNRKVVWGNKSRFRNGVDKEIRKFCEQNFDGMTDEILEDLYVRVRDRRGLEMPLREFE